VLLILIGSDLSMMETLTSYGRPFHQRGAQMTVAPLNPADLSVMAGLSAADAFDATLITGGLPIICARWKNGEDTRSFLARELANPVSPLVVSAQLSLSAEFPDQVQARAVLAAIGSGERTFTNIARAAGGIAHSTLTRATDLLISKGVVAGDLPISLAPSKERRYRITDTYLRFWLAFLGPHLTELDRMRSDITLDRIFRSWASWRGRAIEPLIREALARLLPAQGIPAAPAIGGYWTRSNDVEIDIVGADREPVARQLLFLGSVKWLETAQFDDHDLVELQRHRDRVSSEPVPLIAISRTGIATNRIDAAFGPEGLLEAWLLLWSFAEERPLARSASVNSVVRATVGRVGKLRLSPRTHIRAPDLRLLVSLHVDVNKTAAHSHRGSSPSRTHAYVHEPGSSVPDPGLSSHEVPADGGVSVPSPTCLRDSGDSPVG
jgi:hypothetical protein